MRAIRKAGLTAFKLPRLYSTRKLRPWTGGCILLCLAVSPGLADEPFELDTVIVTAPYAGDPIQDLPRSVSVITARDIENATTDKLGELLAREANINLRSFLGQNKFANIDIRGMGETSTSNVIIQVDGFRLNAPDLSGADLSSIPLSQIERIEILRGSNAVRYGNGAVGGVINIITRKTADQLAARLDASAGSFDTRKVAADINLAGKTVRARFNVALANSDGHRQNNDSETRDVSLRVSLQPLPRLDLDLRASYHDDHYGFPGAVSQTEFATSRGRRNSRTPNDFSETIERQYQALLDLDLEKYGQLTARLHARNRDNPFVLGFTPLLSIEDQRGLISEQSINTGVEHASGFFAAGLPIDLNWGISGFFSDYIRRENGSQQIGQSKRNRGDVEEIAAFVSAETEPRTGWLLNLGYRIDRFAIERRNQRLVQLFNGFVPAGSAWQTTLDDNSRWYNHAAELGVSRLLSDATTAYINLARSFRNPNIDELTLSSPDLSPQSGWQTEVGYRHRRRWLETALSLFHTRTKDEIFFAQDPVSGASVNRNYDDDVLRTGGELEMKVRYGGDFYIWSNLSWTRARFADSGNEVPHVPRFQANAGLEWQPVPALTFSLSASYTGSRFDGNDPNNDLYRKLDDYLVADARLSWSYRSVRLFAGVNNLFDETYTTVGFSENYYPMPERHFLGGFSLSL